MGDLDKDSDSCVSSDSDQDSDDDGGSGQKGNSNPEGEDNVSDNSEQESDDDGRSSIGMSYDIWSGEPRQLSTTTLKSFIGTIDGMIPDLDNDQEREEWREGKSELEDELSRRNNNR